MKRGGDPRATHRPDDSEVRAAREDADGQDDTNAQLRAMRAVWLAMREEDPPDGGLVDLLAAARAKAATMRVRPTLWQRVLAVLRRPPALAFATVVVLVGGAVLFIGRGKGMRSELAAGSSGAAAKEMSVRSEPSVKEPPVSIERAAPVATTHEDLGAMSVEVEEVAGKRAGMQRVPAKPKRAQLEELYRQCSSAARRGDCATVRQVVGRIAKTDRDYRARVFKEAAVVKCLADHAAAEASQ